MEAFKDIQEKEGNGGDIQPQRRDVNGTNQGLETARQKVLGERSFNG